MIKMISAWLEEPEIEKIISYLNPDDIMLEWGAGGSTLLFSSFVKKYISIEHDKKWYDHIKFLGAKINNLELHFVPNNEPYYKFATSRSQFKDYVEIIHKLGYKYDKVFIDGRARLFCAVEVLKYLKPNSIVFIHDFHSRPRYYPVFEFYDPIDDVLSKCGLIVLKPKKKLKKIKIIDRYEG